MDTQSVEMSASVMDQLEESLLQRYPEAPGFVGKTKAAEEFRNYEQTARSTVREFYRLNHTHQTLDFVLTKKNEYLALNRAQMSVWEAMEFLNSLVDDSDPDTDYTQIEHLLQTSEQVRRDGHPRWFILTGLLHDLGKILCLWGEPQWAVVGDTFPVGCRPDDRIVFHEFFAQNPDSHIPQYQAPLGIYQQGCGIGNLHLSWGHDEYIYNVVKDYLPDQALAMLRFHSFYPWHKEGAYAQFMAPSDAGLLEAVRAFNPYDLYTKSHERPDVAALRPYYEDLISEFLPATLRW